VKCKAKQIEKIKKDQQKMWQALHGEGPAHIFV
jgi:hypothetical protein